MRLIVAGTGASPGRVLGRARLQHPPRPPVDPHPLEDGQLGAEIHRFHAGLEVARSELARLRERLREGPAREAAEFLDAHALMLSDPELIAAVEGLVHGQRLRAVHALELLRERLVAAFEAVDDPYLRGRRDDIEQVLARIQAHLPPDGSTGAARPAAPRAGEILVTGMLGPSELVALTERGTLGVVLTGGSTMSHIAILARSLHLPLVVAAREAFAGIDNGDLLLVDGASGQTIVHPGTEDLAAWRRWQREESRRRHQLGRYAHAPTRTRDGRRVELYANAESATDIVQARAFGARGLGLYRTEFLFLKQPLPPDEDEQFFAYRDAVLAMDGLPLNFRTLDLGADKIPGSGQDLRAEDNPALGLRGVRLSLQQPHLLRTQLRALLRAAVYGPVRILVPMVTRLEELRAVRALLGEAAAGLALPHPPPVPLGAMIEVPAAALALQGLVAEVDFLAVGSNDLVQYLLAVDRNHETLGELYDPLHPAVLRLLAGIFSSARRAGLPVTLCGEMAADPACTPALLALGLERFSVHPAHLLALRERIAGLDHARLRRGLPALLRAHSREAIAGVLAGLEPGARKHTTTGG